jgi:hypothetical protein
MAAAISPAVTAAGSDGRVSYFERSLQQLSVACFSRRRFMRDACINDLKFPGGRVDEIVGGLQRVRHHFLIAALVEQGRARKTAARDDGHGLEKSVALFVDALCQ